MSFLLLWQYNDFIEPNYECIILYLNSISQKPHRNKIMSIIGMKTQRFRVSRGRGPIQTVNTNLVTIHVGNASVKNT